MRLDDPAHRAYAPAATAASMSGGVRLVLAATAPVRVWLSARRRHARHRAITGASLALRLIGS